MFLLDSGIKNCGPLSLIVKCPDSDITFRGITTEITSSGFCLEVPTTRIKTTLSCFLSKNVGIVIDTINICGIINCYTIEGDYYIIRIEIGKNSRQAWKTFLAEKTRLSLRTEIRHAAP